MPFDGSGNFTRLMNWVADAAASIKIRADRHDTEDDNFAAGLTNCITKDGQTQPTADIPMNGKKIVNLADPTAAQDVATKAYVDKIKGILSVTSILTSQTWTKPVGCTHIDLEYQAAGGAGGGVNCTATTAGAGGGGGAGASNFVRMIDVRSSASVAVTIGAGGIGQPGATGAVGGNTVCAIASGSTYTATGGDGGQGGAAQTAVYGFAGGNGGVSSSGSGAQAGMPSLANAAFVAMSGSGAGSRFGNGGLLVRIFSSFSHGNPGSGYGAGGSGGAGMNTGAPSILGGNGMPGLVRITAYQFPVAP